MERIGLFAINLFTYLGLETVCCAAKWGIPFSRVNSNSNKKRFFIMAILFKSGLKIYCLGIKQRCPIMLLSKLITIAFPLSLLEWIVCFLPLIENVIDVQYTNEFNWTCTEFKDWLADVDKKLEILKDAKIIEDRLFYLGSLLIVDRHLFVVFVSFY